MLPWLLLAACHRPPEAVPRGDVVLGWRLAPGMELSYALRSTHTQAHDTIVREETWHYLVRSADPEGLFLLEGHLRSLEASMQQDGVPREGLAFEAALLTERERLEQHPTMLLLSLDGRLEHLEAAEWSDALLQRMLALRLPSEPVAPGERWTETDTARAFSRLVPAGLEASFGGTQRLEGLQWEEHDGGFLRAPAPFLAARITGEAMLQPQDARFPAVDVQGTAIWDLEAGLLAERVVTVAERGGTRPEQTGDLTIEIALVPEPRGLRGAGYPPWRSR